MRNRGLGDRWAFGKPHRPFMTPRKQKWSLVAAATVFFVIALSTVAVATVWTDQSDYTPGSVVTISGDNSNGAGYLPGETVLVEVSGPNGYQSSCEGVADESGAWSCQVTLWDSDLAVGDYTYTATGQTSGVSETGTFGDAPNTENVNFATTGLPPGTSVSVTYNGTNPGGQSQNGTATFNAPGPSTAVGFQGDSTLRCTFPASIVVSGTTYNLSSQPCGASGVTLPTASSPTHTTTFTGVYSGAPSNHAPTVTVDNATVTVDEGSQATNTGTWADQDAGDTVALTASVGSVTENVGGTWNWSFGTTDGPADSQTVTITATDNHSASNFVTFSLVVNNVAPTGTFNTPSAHVNEGSSFNLSITGVTDPSSVDTTAGFEYAFDCGAGYGAFGTVDSVTCNTAVDGPATLTVKGKVRDKDLGTSEYTGTVTVDNVSPTLGALTFGGAGGVACIGGNSVTVGDISWTDPAGALDEPFVVAINWGDGNTDTFSGINALSLADKSHAYGAGGPYTISVTVTDKDGGTSTAVTSASFSFLYNVTGVLQPVNDTQAHQDPSVFKYGSTIPVKIRVTDCSGTVVPGLDPQISVKKIAGSTPPSGTDETITSTSGADTGTTMRFDTTAGQYIYNLATKSLSDSSGTYQITITGPFLDVTALFGTKPK